MKQKVHGRLIKKINSIILLGGITSPALSKLPEVTPPKAEEEYYFPAEVLGDKKVDLSYFSAPGKGPPGKYQVDVFVNREKIDNRLLFFSADPQGNLVPELTLKQYEALGLKIAALPDMKEFSPDQVVTNITQYGVTTYLDINKLRLDIGIPQELLNIRAKDYIDPAFWDAGMPAAFVSYDLSGSQTYHLQKNQDNRERERQFLNLRNGINFAGWRLRNYSTWQHDSTGKNEFDSLQNWLERDIVSLRSTIAAGDTSTASDAMDSFSFRGISLRSQAAMLAPSEQGYVPVIRGIAMTPNARVSIRQGDTLIYETYVPAGAFALTDIVMSGGGRLDIQVTESDGRIQRFSQYFGHLSIMQREGHLNYEFALGEYRQPGRYDTYHPRFAQMTSLYGLTSGLTLYGGGIVADDYSAGTVGAGITLGAFGTVALDVSHANSILNTGDNKNGQALRIQYNKNFNDTGTHFTMASWQYQDEGYYTFTDAGNLRRRVRKDSPWGWELHKQKKSKIQLDIQQKIGPLGSLSLNAWQQDYYDRSYQQSAGASWNVSIAQVSLGLNYSLSEYKDRKTLYTRDHNINLTVSLPLSVFSSSNSAYASWSLMHNKAGHTKQVLSLSGSALEQHNLSYSLQQYYSNVNKEGYGGSLAAGFRGRAGEVNAAWSYGKDSRRISYGAKGSVVAHPYGITLSQRLAEGSGYVLVRAPGASGVGVTNKSGVATDWRGYTVVPSVQAYRKNRITLDPATYSAELDMASNSLQVIPMKEALVLADYQIRKGARALFTLIKQDGAMVPFGATASVAGSRVGIVGDNGALYLAGLEQEGIIDAVWGTGAGESCRGRYNLTAAQHVQGISMLVLQCQ